MALRPVRCWPEVCRAVEREDLIDDGRFATARDRLRHHRECVAELDAVFAARTLAVREARLRAVDLEAPRAPMRSAPGTHDDPQVRADGCLREADGADRGTCAPVSAPVQLDGPPRDLDPAPEMGEHAGEVLLELGLSWDELGGDKKVGAIP